MRIFVMLCLMYYKIENKRVILISKMPKVVLLVS